DMPITTRASAGQIVRSGPECAGRGLCSTAYTIHCARCCRDSQGGPMPVPAVTNQAATNQLLARLSDSERVLLKPSSVELQFKEPILEQGKPVNYVYFVDRGVVSQVIDLEQGDTIETGTIGREGMVGLSVLFHSGKSPGRALCQIPGAAT